MPYCLLEAGLIGNWKDGIEGEQDDGERERAGGWREGEQEDDRLESRT